MVFSILFGHIVELCSNVWSNDVRLFSIMFGSLDWLPKFCLAGNYVGRFLDLWFVLLSFISNFVRLYVRQVGWSLVRRNVRAVLGQVHFPVLFMIYSNYFQGLCPAQIKHGHRARGPRSWYLLLWTVRSSRALRRTPSGLTLLIHSLMRFCWIRWPALSDRSVIL